MEFNEKFNFVIIILRIKNDIIMINGVIEGFRNPSEVIGPHGEVIEKACENDDEILVSEINLNNYKIYKDVRIKYRQPTIYKIITKVIE